MERRPGARGERECVCCLQWRAEPPRRREVSRAEVGVGGYG